VVRRQAGLWLTINAAGAICSVPPATLPHARRGERVTPIVELRDGARAGRTADVIRALPGQP
jgi:hypothetical protein